MISSRFHCCCWKFCCNLTVVIPLQFGIERMAIGVSSTPLSTWTPEASLTLSRTPCKCWLGEFTKKYLRITQGVHILITELRMLLAWQPIPSRLVIVNSLQLAYRRMKGMYSNFPALTWPVVTSQHSKTKYILVRQRDSGNGIWQFGASWCYRCLSVLCESDNLSLCYHE